MSDDDVQPHEMAFRSPCLASGFCCHQVPCTHGESISPSEPACRFLVPWEVPPGPALKAPRYRCGKAEEIMRDPTAHVTPAFGAGCCSPLFNEERQAIQMELMSTDEGRAHLVQLRRNLRDHVRNEDATGRRPALRRKGMW